MLDMPKQVAGNTVDVETLGLAPGELAGILHQPDNLPTLEINYEGITDTALPVYFNDFLVGMLQPGLDFMEFAVPEHLIFLENTVCIENISAQDFLLKEKTFWTGSIDDADFAVPEPGTFILLGIGFLGVRYPFRKCGVPSFR